MLYAVYISFVRALREYSSFFYYHYIVLILRYILQHISSTYNIISRFIYVNDHTPRRRAHNLVNIFCNDAHTHNFNISFAGKP